MARPRNAATETTTKSSVSNGRRRSIGAKSLAGDVAGSSNQENPGTSDTPISTDQSRSDQSTEAATGQRRHTKRSGDAATPAAGEVAAAVRRDLDSIARVAPELATSALAASALSLAREMDDAGNSATSKSMCARALLDTLDRMRELMPIAEEADELDELVARGDTKRSGGSTPEGL